MLWTLSALNLQESGRKRILKIDKYSLWPVALYENQWYYSYLTMERSEIIQWTRIMSSKSLILEHKTWFLLTHIIWPIYDITIWARTLSISGQVEFTCLFNAFLSSLGRLTVTASFWWSVTKLFFLFLGLDSALSDWLEVGDRWGFLTNFRRLHSLFWCYILMKTMNFYILLI